MLTNKMKVLSVDTALLLYAISYECMHKGAASIEGIFRAEDAINRSAKTYEEMKQGLQLLLSIGLIKQEDKKFKVTIKGRSILEEVTQEKAYVFEQIKKLREVLKPLIEKANFDTSISFNQIDYDNAYSKYYSKT